MITKSERTIRIRQVKAGEWNDAWVTLGRFQGGRQFFALRANMRPDGTVRFTLRNAPDVIVPIGDVVSVVH